MSRAPRVPDRETKKAPKVAHYREKIGRHHEVVETKEKKTRDAASAKASTSASRNYRSFALLVLGMLFVLVAILVAVRIASH